MTLGKNSRIIHFVNECYFHKGDARYVSEHRLLDWLRYWCGSRRFRDKLFSEREQQLLALQQPAQGAVAPAVPLAELQRQKEELEDMIAAQEAAQAE